ncbi:MAG: hypothetical protein WCG29_04290 [Desulfomonile sp.]|jgi:hypothetical protein|nr:hypothetical protein [Deltaproteobacteria bacterium]
MFRKLRKSSLTIPVELHEKIARSCEPIDQVPSEVICIRAKDKRFPENKSRKQSYVHVLVQGV